MGRFHVTIHCCPDGYHLEGAKKVFETVPKLISFYQQQCMEENQVLEKGAGIANISVSKGSLLGSDNQLPDTDTPHLCETIPDTPLGQHSAPSESSHYETINEQGIYSQGKPADLMKYDWYHGNITEEQAETALELPGNINSYLVRKSGQTLILSKRIKGRRTHDTIHRNPEGYCLEGKEEVFKSVSLMIFHYLQHPIEGGHVLGAGIRNIPGFLTSNTAETCKKTHLYSVDSMCNMAGVYAKGSVLGSDQDWYHGQLSRVEAEHALTASGCDCFLVRESEGALVLSLIHHEQVHHVNIKYGPGWYELEVGSAQYSFPELEELVSHYSSQHISEGLKLTLGVSCQKTNTTDRLYLISDSGQHPESSPNCNGLKIYSQGKPADLMKYDWYHENITEEQAEMGMGLGNDNTFLVRKSGQFLMLSKRIQGWKTHDTILRSPKGYYLEGKEELFKSVPEMIFYYQQHPIQDNHVLGIGIADIPALHLKTSLTPGFSYKSSNFLNIVWKKCGDAQVGNAIPPVVKIEDHVYVGYGLRRAQEKTNIYKYSITLDTWSALPDCPTVQHGLATLDGELIVVGGRIELATNHVYTFRENIWQQVLPPMPTARWLLASTSHGNRLIIAAGGVVSHETNGQVHRTDVVEIYNKDNSLWYATKRLPFVVSQFPLYTTGDTCYILGGTTCTRDQSRTILYATVSSLLKNSVPVDGEYATPQTQITWKNLQDKHPLTFPSLVELNGRLVAMGGSVDGEHRMGSKFISAYDFATNTWVECKGAELPLPLYRPGLLNLGNNKVMLIGGQPKSQEFSSAVFIGSYK